MGEVVLGPLEAETVVAAPVEVVWSALSDLRAMPRRSPETIAMLGRSAPRVGSRTLNLNRRRLVVWPTLGRITQWKPPTHDGAAALAFAVWPSDVEWSYELTADAAGGTRVRERRSALADPRPIVRFAQTRLLGGAREHDAELLAGMHRTLAALRRDAEAAHR